VWPTLGSRTAKKQNRIQRMRNRLVRRRAEFHSVNLQFTGNYCDSQHKCETEVKVIFQIRKYAQRNRFKRCQSYRPTINIFEFRKSCIVCMGVSLL